MSKFAGLLALFTIVPLIELALLIPLGQAIGLWPTIALVLVTGVLGAVLGKSEGLRAWRRIQEDLAQAKMPGDAILDGLAVLIACAFLVTPGVLTDVAGIALLLPFMRRPIKALIRRRFTHMLESPTGPSFIGFSSFEGFPAPGEFYGHPGHGGGRYQGEDVIDVTPSTSDQGRPEVLRPGLGNDDDRG